MENKIIAYSLVAFLIAFAQPAAAIGDDDCSTVWDVSVEGCQEVAMNAVDTTLNGDSCHPIQGGMTIPGCSDFVSTVVLETADNTLNGDACNPGQGGLTIWGCYDLAAAYAAYLLTGDECLNGHFVSVPGCAEVAGSYVASLLQNENCSPGQGGVGVPGCHKFVEETASEAPQTVCARINPYCTYIGG